MKVIDADTGKRFQLHSDEDLERELREHSVAADCRHGNTEIRRALVAGGNIQFRSQCLECGALVGSPISYSKAPKDASEVDTGLNPRWEETQDKRRSEILQKYVRKQKARETAFWIKYNAYLASPEWRAKSSEVLKRAGGLCEGCRKQTATQAHHLTYAHVFNEFLFELVAVCGTCHERLHAESAAEQPLDQLEDYAYDEQEFSCVGCRYQGSHEHTQWCMKFDIEAGAALSPEGPCGPQQRELEPLK